MKKSTGHRIALLWFALALLVALLVALPVAGQIPIEEGDIEESFEEYGDDSDEVYELDDAVVVPVDSLLKGIRWLGHSSFLIEGSKTIYIDPYNLSDAMAKTLPRADIILATHEHQDHFSPADIKKLINAKTTVVSIKGVIGDMPEEVKHTRVVSPGDTIKVAGIKIEVVPAYNIETSFHPRAKGHVGYVVHMDGMAVYHAGDTDLIPEMKAIKCDVALLPAGGKFTMNADEAAQAANLIKPKVAVPMHWGTIIGSKEDAGRFTDLCTVPARVLGDMSRPAPKQVAPAEG
jgi:L-ascorbate metabolism protein UlaG (beta-lactamase superfamily)